MRRFLAPAVREQAQARRRTEGLVGLELAAAVTADQIHAALIRHAADDPVDTPAEYADAELPLDTVEDELLHLQRVASYFTPPAPGPRTPGRRTPDSRDASESSSTTSGARS